MSHPDTSHDVNNERIDDSPMAPTKKNAIRKMKVHSTNHGERKLFHYNGKMKEAPGIRLKKSALQDKKK